MQKLKADIYFEDEARRIGTGWRRVDIERGARLDLRHRARHRSPRAAPGSNVRSDEGDGTALALDRADAGAEMKPAKAVGYKTVNGAWPEAVPPITGPEAITAVKRLWRQWIKAPLPRAKYIITGKRVQPVRIYHVRTGRWEIHISTFYGWRGVVHSISHKVHARLHGHSRTGFHDHDSRHHFIEREMIAHVVNSGWLDGKLHRPEKIVTRDPSAELAAKRDRIAAKIKRWQAKRKRADTALRKLAKQSRYYERQQAA